jgi:hypothetical protein
MITLIDGAPRLLDRRRPITAFTAFTGFSRVAGKCQRLPDLTGALFAGFLGSGTNSDLQQTKRIQRSEKKAGSGWRNDRSFSATSLSDIVSAVVAKGSRG